MKKLAFFSGVIMLLTLGCMSKEQMQLDQDYPFRWVGDIGSDPELDDSDFSLCHGDEHVFQYFNIGEGFEYAGEKTEFERQIREAYRDVDVEQSGWIRIRFIVNCHGEAGRFRLLGGNTNFDEMTFDSRITDQLMRIIKNLDGWEILENEDMEPSDYYLYVIFKIENGQILEVIR